MQKIKKGDTVLVTIGKDRGKRGKVLAIMAEEGKVIVEGVALKKRHMKAGSNPKYPNGGIVDKPAKIDISNVKFFSEKLGRPVRVGVKQLDDGRKVRVARGSRGEEHVLD
jgi:large subunit ribosomal protein L24